MSLNIQIQLKDKEIERIRLAKNDLSIITWQITNQLEHPARLEKRAQRYQESAAVFTAMCNAFVMRGEEGIYGTKQEWQSVCTSTKVISRKLRSMMK